jgi:branched-chain amino acid transport system permease protein
LEGKFTSVAGINPDYSYGRNNMAAFVAMLKRFNIPHNVVTEQWPRSAPWTSPATSPRSGGQARPDLFVALFADLGVHEAGARGQADQGYQARIPGGRLAAHPDEEGVHAGGHAVRPQRTLYFANPNASPLAEFVAWYEKTYKDYPEWEADRAYFAIASYKAAVEKAAKAKNGSWPSQDDVIDAMVGLSVESLGGKGSWRKDHIADQTFVQGFTTHNNKYDFVTLGSFGRCIPPTCRSRPARISGSGSEPRSSDLIQTRWRLQISCSAACSTPRMLFPGRRRVAAGVRRAENPQSRLRVVLRGLLLTPFIGYAAAVGLSPWLILPGLLVAGAVLGVIGPPIERLLRSVYGRDESFQLLLTFALVLMFQDVFRFIWGANPRSLDSAYLIYGTISTRDFSVPVYNLLVIAAAIAVAAGLGAFLQRTNFGRILRATAENRAMAEALGVDVRRVYSAVFTLGTVLGTTAGALVVPTAAASLDMAIEFVIEAFAVVVIGGLGSMRGALVGALIVGLIRAYSIVLYPELEVLAIYAIVIAVLLLRPAGLFGRPVA